jgi:hypothetical protein
MCIQLLTADEAWRNLGEMVVSDEHREEVMLLLTQDDDED